MPSFTLPGRRRQNKPPVQIPAIIRETGQFASHSPPAPPQSHIRLTKFPTKFTALPCAFHLGFGLVTWEVV